MAKNELQNWFESLPDKLEAEIAAEFAQIVDEELVEPIREAAPQGSTGNLKASVRKDPGASETEWVVKAGGPLTTKQIREGSGVEYDYANATEFGTSRESAQPFFYSTARAHWGRLQARVKDLVNSKIGKF